MRPRCEAPRMPRHSICSRWVDDEAVAKRADASVKPVSSFRACGARPSRGVSRGEMALRRKARGSRDGRFSRRDALCASAWQGRTQAGASHDYGRANERLVAKKRQHFGWRDVDITGVRSPPLPGGEPRWNGLPEEGPGMTRKAIFSEGRTLCVRLARPYGCRGISFRPDA